MSAEILDGKATAQQIRTELAEEVRELTEKLGRPPGLTVVIVGEDPASKVYVRMKHRACGEIGIASEVIEMSVETTTEELLATVKRLNADRAVDGILVQLPLPKQIDEQTIIEAVAPDKDVDCFHPINVGLMMVGKARFLPCTPAGCLELLRRAGHTTRGKNVTIVGRSNIVGRPLSVMLAHRGEMADATVTVCHTKTRDLAAECRRAEILIVAAGVPQCVTADMISPGAVVVDVGVNRVEDTTTKSGYRLVGDVEFEGAKGVASAITPVPGGVGPMTIAMLLTNACTAARGHLGV
ncbi:bifunctional methylenetetrahydrofolate dehydrogenase/methenyltetrahydrofolate cyclohydrolase FolD [Candidatus Sumerlaeota bacterium]|nr:bifunctional methylenetetrahydrofolate dehydrogenase/methenyltetrahydrofolate cyclohydrolase FolD [Candidatus Sumerlaeota bacterium]